MGQTPNEDEKEMSFDINLNSKVSLFDRTPERRIPLKEEDEESPNYFEDRARANMLTKSSPTKIREKNGNIV
jgi:hypothetical protein